MGVVAGSAETNKAEPQGDATLEKAVYGLYAREDIVHPDGATGVIYKAGDKVASLTTNEKGEAVAENLYLGKYFVKEITPPTGYLTDKNEYDRMSRSSNPYGDGMSSKYIVDSIIKKFS